jgi:hypothetical protein
MSIYTVHEPTGALDPVERGDRTRFVREGFNLWAFLFGPLFLLWHRLWLALAGWLLLAALIAAARFGLHLHPEACTALGILTALFFGIEGNDMRRWSLDQRGYRLADVIAGADRAIAETVFFHRRDIEPAAPVAATARWAGGGDPTPAVIGMFPDGSR